MPTEFAGDVYDKVVGGGRGHDLRHAGAFAFDALRLERGFRSWGHDIGVLDDPYAVGLGFAVRLEKDGFVGEDALAALHDAPRDRELVSVKLEDPGPDAVARGARVLIGKERLGHVTSGAYGHTWAPPSGSRGSTAMSPPTPVTVEVRGAEVRATLSREPFYDPTGDRLRLTRRDRDLGRLRAAPAPGRRHHRGRGLPRGAEPRVQVDGGFRGRAGTLRSSAQATHYGRDAARSPGRVRARLRAQADRRVQERGPACSARTPRSTALCCFSPTATSSPAPRSANRAARTAP